MKISKQYLKKMINEELAFAIIEENLLGENKDLIGTLSKNQIKEALLEMIDEADDDDELNQPVGKLYKGNNKNAAKTEDIPAEIINAVRQAAKDKKEQGKPFNKIKKSVQKIARQIGIPVATLAMALGIGKGGNEVGSMLAPQVSQTSSKKEASPEVDPQGNSPTKRSSGPLDLKLRDPNFKPMNKDSLKPDFRLVNTDKDKKKTAIPTPVKAKIKPAAKPTIKDMGQIKNYLSQSSIKQLEDMIRDNKINPQKYQQFIKTADSIIKNNPKILSTGKPGVSEKQLTDMVDAEFIDTFFPSAPKVK